MSSPLRPVWAEISKQNLLWNLQLIRKSIDPKAFLCPMVKANAYGHGDLEICKWLSSQKVSSVGVVMVEEALRLKQLNLSLDILVFGIFGRDGATEIVEKKLVPVISTWEQLLNLKSAFAKRSDKSLKELPLHLKLNTGMNRLGFDTEEAEKLTQFFKETPQFKVVGICTHLSTSEDCLEEKTSVHQMQVFEKALQKFPSWDLKIHVQNSGAILRKWDWAGLSKRKGDHAFLKNSDLGARPGIGLYGALPDMAIDVDLKPVMSLYSKFVILRWIDAGEAVSYGGAWRASKRSLIGVLPVGYADGIPRASSNRAQYMLNSTLIPQRGVVCMDHVMVDLTDHPKRDQIKIEDTVLLFGEKLKGPGSLQDFAAASGQISYEVLTGISDRVPRIFKGGKT